MTLRPIGSGAGGGGLGAPMYENTRPGQGQGPMYENTRLGQGPSPASGQAPTYENTRSGQGGGHPLQRGGPVRLSGSGQPIELEVPSSEPESGESSGCCRWWRTFCAAIRRCFGGRGQDRSDQSSSTHIPSPSHSRSHSPVPGLMRGPGVQGSVPPGFLAQHGGGGVPGSPPDPGNIPIVRELQQAISEASGSPHSTPAGSPVGSRIGSGGPLRQPPPRPGGRRGSPSPSGGSGDSIVGTPLPEQPVPPLLRGLPPLDPDNDIHVYEEVMAPGHQPKQGCFTRFWRALRSCFGGGETSHSSHSAPSQIPVPVPTGPSVGIYQGWPTQENPPSRARGGHDNAGFQHSPPSSPPASPQLGQLQGVMGAGDPGHQGGGHARHGHGDRHGSPNRAGHGRGGGGARASASPPRGEHHRGDGHRSNDRHRGDRHRGGGRPDAERPRGVHHRGGGDPGRADRGRDRGGRTGGGRNSPSDPRDTEV